MLTVYRPVETNWLNQGFGENSTCIPVDANGNVIYPITGVITKVGDTCPVGYTDFYKGMGMKGHNGYDNAAYHGEPVFFSAVAPGVEWYCKSERDGSGGIGVDVVSRTPVELKDGSKSVIKFRFWHLKDVAHSDGTTITPGMLIGWADNTGASSGDHLHWSMKPCTLQGAPLAPFNGYNGVVDFSPYYINSFILDVLGVARPSPSIWQLIHKTLFAIRAYWRR